LYIVQLRGYIAIIAILASMLLPALGRARAIAKRSLCLNNQKQVSMALFLYADEYDDYIPKDYDSANYSTYERHWASRLKVYLGIPESKNLASWEYEDIEPVFQCTSSPIAQQISFNGNQSMSALNVHIDWTKAGRVPKPSELILIDDPKPWFWAGQGWKIGYQTSRIIPPGYTLADGRFAVGNNHLGNPSLEINGTSGGSNMIFLDGSGANINNHDLNTNANLNPATQ
jgi:hypothetical protein